MRAGKRAERFRGTADLPNFFRKPYGPGWALVGDAGYHKDPITGLGITDAFRDAELLAEALDAGFSGRQPLAEALAGYQRQRDEAAAPGFAATLQFAHLQPPPPEMQQLLGALQHNQEQTNRFLGTVVGTVSRRGVLRAGESGADHDGGGVARRPPSRRRIRAGSRARRWGQVGATRWVARVIGSRRRWPTTRVTHRVSPYLAEQVPRGNTESGRRACARLPLDRPPPKARSSGNAAHNH